MNDMKEKLRGIALRDGRFAPDAYYFLFESLEVAVELAGKKGLQGAARHVSGRDVLAGMREHALAIFGPLTPQVWRAWGIKDTLDWGRVVFVLVDAGMLKRQAEDRLEDFADGFDFERTFVEPYQPALTGVLAPRGAAPDAGPASAPPAGTES
jgi:uncharacterized repeat protein (TIGR04138 family)